MDITDKTAKAWLSDFSTQVGFSETAGDAGTAPGRKPKETLVADHQPLARDHVAATGTGRGIRRQRTDRPPAVDRTSTGGGQIVQ
jgi:hypothetical protein